MYTRLLFSSRKEPGDEAREAAAVAVVTDLDAIWKLIFRALNVRVARYINGNGQKGHVTFNSAWVVTCATNNDGHMYK